MIKTSNGDVSPADVEMELQSLPGACVGVRRRASLAAAEGIEGTTVEPEWLITELRKRLSGFEVSRRIVVLERSEVPMLEMSNKVHKKALKELISEAKLTHGA